MVKSQEKKEGKKKKSNQNLGSLHHLLDFFIFNIYFKTIKKYMAPWRDSA